MRVVSKVNVWTIPGTRIRIGAARLLNRGKQAHSMNATEARYIQRRDYQTVAYSHFIVDVLNSSRSLLVAILALLIGLSNTQVALVLLLYNVGNALTQPFFGRLADRLGPRWPVIGGIGWMIIFFSLAALAPPWPALFALTVAGLGSGAFHPTGTMVASEASDHHRTQATSVFFMAGQLGLFTGPVIAGVLLEAYGRPGYVVLPLWALTALAAAWFWLNSPAPDHEADGKKGQSLSWPEILPLFATSRALLLGLIILCVGTVSTTAVTFAPKLFTELGYSASYVGLLTGIFMLGSAVGGVTGGVLADRRNGRFVILLATAASVLPVILYINANDIARLLLFLTAGFFVGMPHSVLVLMVQKLLPGQRATASGFALGFMFFSGSVGVLVVGMIADQVGLALAMQLTAVLAAVAFLSALRLPAEQV
jgi:MFS transporter, FSR family, fosmidomycin resistance protein